MNLNFEKLCEISKRTLSDIIEGAFYGNHEWSLDWDEDEYNIAKNAIKKGDYDPKWGICQNDVLAKMIKSGFQVKVHDEEADETYVLTKESLERGVDAFFTKCPEYISDFITDPDQCSDWAFIQCCLFGNVVFG